MNTKEQDKYWKQLQQQYKILQKYSCVWNYKRGFLLMLNKEPI